MDDPPVTEAYAWTPPQYDPSRPPSLQASFALHRSSDPIQNFSRTAKWCPDGSLFLSHCEDRTFQFFNTPPGSVGAQQDAPRGHTSAQPPIRTFRQPSPILDFLWYPAATPLDPASFCFLASVRECPVKLLDASDGRLRASYRIVDHRERQIAPHSLAFNQTAERLYCGFEDAIEVFDFSRPGEGTRLMTTPSKKSKDGLKGIISALAFVPSLGVDTYAAGTLAPAPGNLALFTEARGQEPEMFVGGGPRAGVTQIAFNPARPHMLYAAFRRHAAIYSWDIRSGVDAPLRVYHPTPAAASPSPSPDGRTNQRIRFDVDLGGRWLSTGDQDGHIALFDLSTEDSGDADADAPRGLYDNPDDVAPALVFKAHADAVGAVAFHPLRPALLSASGARHFHPRDDGDEEGSSDSGEDDDGDDGKEDEGGGGGRVPGITRQRFRSQPVTRDSSIKMWDFDGSRPAPADSGAGTGA